MHASALPFHAIDLGADVSNPYLGCMSRLYRLNAIFGGRIVTGSARGESSKQFLLGS